MKADRYCAFVGMVGCHLYFASIGAAEERHIDPAAGGTLQSRDVAQTKTRIGCIGDSITNGAGTTAPDGASNSYPAQLQRMLGDRLEVVNFGVGGTTLLNKGDSPYQSQQAFSRAKDFEPDVVIIMLGTNDTKPQNWKYKDEFAADYEDIVRQFSGLSSRPRIYVCRPCFVVGAGNFGINEPSVEMELPLIDEVGKKLGLETIDIFGATKEHDALFPDRVHPNNEGAALIAKEVFKAIVGKDFDGPSAIVLTAPNPVPAHQ
jgi:acyl-CoA thioesterase I